MKQLFYCRHGESLVNIRDVFATRQGTENDLGLTKAGRAQANTAGKALEQSGQRFDLILASPLKRAQETAEIIARYASYPATDIEIVQDLKETQFGELEGTSWQAYWDSGQTYEDLGKYEGAETIAMLQQRAERLLAYVKSRPEDTILLVGHSCFGRALRRVIEGKPYTDEFVNHDSLPHGEILRLI